MVNPQASQPVDLSESSMNFIGSIVADKIATAMRTFEEKLNEKIQRFSIQLSEARAENGSLRRQLDEVRVQMDDLQQYGRRMSIRIENLPVLKNGESSEEIFNQVKETVSGCGVVLEQSDIVRLHRSSKPRTNKTGVLVVQTLVKLGNWRAREKFRGFNKKAHDNHISVRANNDLTTRRYQLLSPARERIDQKLIQLYGSSQTVKELPDVQKVFALADINSRL